MKRIISIILAAAMVFCLSVTAFAKDGDEIKLITEADISGAVGVVPFAVVDFAGGKVGSYPEAGMLIIEKNEKLYVLGAKFDNPTGLAVDEAGNLYVSETNQGRIIKITTKGRASIYRSGLLDPTGLCWKDKTLYIAETGTNRIMSLKNFALKTVCGQNIYEGGGEYEGAYVDGLKSDARFDHPKGVAVADDGTVYIADTGNHAIRMLRDGKTYSIMTNRDLTGKLVEPGHLWIDGTELNISEMFGNEILTCDISEKNFADVPEDKWFTSHVNEAVLMGITEGTGENMFSPEGNVTRSQFACMIARAKLYSNGSTVIGGTNVFSDVPEKTWFTDSVCWASDNNIVQGFAGFFNPDDNITRQDIVTMLYRFAVQEGRAPEAKASLHGYTDAEEISEYAYDAFCWAVSAGIINGIPADDSEDEEVLGALNPKGLASRAEAVKIITSYINKEN